MKNSYRTQKSHQKAKSLKGKTIGLLTAIFLMCSLYGYSQTTPPIIAWQYTNTPQFTSTTDLLPSPDYGENWFYNITPTSDGGYLGVGYAEIYPNTGGGVVTQPILVKIDQFGHLVWEQVYDGGKPSDPGFFWQAVESKDAITGQPVYVAMASKSGNDGNGSNYGNIFIVEVDPSNGKIKDNTAGAYPNGYYYGSIFIDGNNSNGSGNITMSSTPIYLANTDVSRSSIETVDYGSGQNGYIITGTQRDYDTNDGSDIKSNAVFLLKLNNDFTFDNTFGAPLSTSSSTPKTGFQLYPYSYPHLAGTAYSPSIAREMTILNNGTPNIQYVVTGWVGSAYTASHGDDIFLVSTDGTGVFQWNQTYTHQQLVDDGYVKDNRVETNAFNAGNPNAYGGENPPANPNDWGMNLVWNQTSNKLYMNAECDLYYGYSNSGGSFYSQVYDTPPATGSNKSPNHADSFLSFSDAILTIDPTNGNLQALTNVAPFDGVDFFPMLINTPDGGLAVAGNKSYTAPGFPDPLTSAELCGCNSLLAYNTLSKTVLGENIDIVKFDASMNKQWEQQYLQSQGTNASAPPNASVNCQWGFAVTQDGGFILGGNNELNDEDYSAMKLVYPSCPNTAISQIPATSVNDLLDLMITTNTTWNSPMYIEGVVDVQPGATLTITGTGTNIQFANKAETGITSKIVVERGAHLIVQNNAVLEGIPSCVSSMWGGIEVWGRSNVPQSLNDTSTGTVTIESGATISDMDLHGITTIRNNSEDEQNWAYTGGVVKANNANFIDNDRAAAFLYYHNTPNSNSNLSEFTDCNFTTSNAPPTGFKFNSFVTMYEVHGIYFKGNTFKNLSAYTSSDPLGRGNGIGSADATYYVEADASNNGNLFTGLSYGIYATSSLHYPIFVNGNVTSGQNNFTNNGYDIYEEGTSYSQIENNIFTKNAQVGPTTYNYFNLYLNGSTNYEVQNNMFTTTTSFPSTPTSSVYGTVVNSSMANPAYINNNSYSGSSSGNMVVGMQAQYNNGNSSTGLAINCNTYNAPIPTADIGIPTGGSIFEYQGIPSSPEGNIFSQTCGTAYDINSAFSFNYKYSTSSASYIPNCVTSSVNTQGYSQPPNCTLSSGGGNPNTLRANRIGYQNTVDSLKNILAAGDAPALYAIINTGSPGQIQNALLASGPYLSDGVLNAAIVKNLPPGTIKNILIPNSPLDSVVKVTLSKVSLPKGISNQINNAQTGTSARSQLQQGIAFFTNQAGIATNALVSYFLKDTAAGSIDSAIAIIKLQQNTCDELLPFAAMQVAANQTVAATATIDTIKSMEPVAYNNYCKLLPLLMNLNNQPNHYFTLLTDTADANTIAQTAADSTLPGYVEARAIMTLVFNKQYAATILPLPKNHNPIKVAEQNNTNNSETNIFKFYPNPTSTEVTVETTIGLGETGFIYFYNMLGEQLLQEQLSNNKTVCNVSQLPQGIYFYSVKITNQPAITGKLVIIR